MTTVAPTVGDRFQLERLRLQERLRSRLRRVHDAQKALVWTVRAARELFDADAAVIAVRRPGREMADVTFAMPTSAAWDVEWLNAYLEDHRPEIPKHRLIAPVKRRGRRWAVMAVECSDVTFDREHRDALFAITRALTEVLHRLDTRRVRKVRRKIEQKIADRQQPKDVIYDILHGLRSLTRYDHSASLFTATGRGAPLRLTAEKIAWTKAKSRRIGQVLELPDHGAQELEIGHVRWFHRVGDRWQPADDGGESVWPALLEYRSGTAPPEETLIVAPIAQWDETPSVLKISARRPGVLDRYEAGLVAEFVALTSLAVQFSVRTETLQERILESERKHVLANLTRGIAHDVNNALGAMLPLVQQMREDVAEGHLDPEALTEDLVSVERSLQTCRRIFGGMLSMAKGSRDGLGHGNLRRSLEGALSVLSDSLRRRSIQVHLDLPAELPLIRGNQGDLTQLFLNLCSNARDAMPEGGELSVRAVQKVDVVEVTVSDTGAGIPTRLRDRIWEPFFTTKSEGHGLGLAICRSILWDIGGDLRFEPRDADGRHEGTRVVVTLPILGGEETPS
ncbi:MAG: HAMP domain-containing sensor histidine kinase [Acidobacteriota bacterium]